MSLYSSYDLDDDFERAHDRLDDETAALSERAVRAEAEADRLREERDAYIDALDTIRRDHSLVGLASTVLNRYGRMAALLDAEDGDE